MKTISIAAAILLFLAVFHFPIGYYTFMRIGVTITTIYLLSYEVKKGINSWVIILAIISILFNPILPIYLNSKDLWIPIDIIAGATLLIFAFTNNKK